MILHCNYEELRALRQGAHVLLGRDRGEERSRVAAPPEGSDDVERLLPRLEGDLDIETLDEQRTVAAGLRAIVGCLREDMESAVVTRHPAHESAIEAYFDYAHALSVLHRAEEMGEEMEALIELVTGDAADDDTARTFVFPD